MSSQRCLSVAFHLPRTALGCLLVALAVASPGAAEPLVYQAVGHSPTDLLVVDLATMTGDWQMTFTQADMVHAITFCPGGGSQDPIYAIGRNGGEVIEVYLSPPTETLVGTLPISFAGPMGGVVQLGCDASGTLYLTSQMTEELFRLDPATCDGVTCTPVKVGRIETSPGAADVDVDGADIQFGPDGTLHVLTNSKGLDRALYTVDTSTALATRVGPVATGDNNNGLTTVPDGRFIVSCNDDYLYEMDPQTAAVAPLGKVSVGGEPIDIRDGDLASPPVFDEVVAICRTAGFWSTHGGNFRGRPNITHAVLDAAGGELEVCGQTLVYGSEVGDLSSPLEAVCVRPRGVRPRSLYRQLVAAALNCVVSGADDCGDLVPDYAACDELCATGEGELNYGRCVRQIDCFNNGGVYDAETKGCFFGKESCHDRPLCDSPEPSLCFDPEGPASSSRDCKEARWNDCTIDGC